MEIGVWIDPQNPACSECPFKRGIVSTPDGNEDVKPDDIAWEHGLVVAAYCFLASLYNSSDERETNKRVRKDGPIPEDCPMDDAFRIAGVG